MISRTWECFLSFLLISSRFARAARETGSRVRAVLVSKVSLSVLVRDDADRVPEEDLPPEDVRVPDELPDRVRDEAPDRVRPLLPVLLVLLTDLSSAISTPFRWIHLYAYGHAVNGTSIHWHILRHNKPYTIVYNRNGIISTKKNRTDVSHVSPVTESVSEIY